MSRRRPSTRALLLVGLVLALLVAGGVSLVASSSPDGLERVAGDHGFLDQEQRHAAADGPLADYQARGVGDERLSGAVAGVVGTVAVLGLAGGLFLLLRRRAPGDA